MASLRTSGQTDLCGVPHSPYDHILQLLWAAETSLRGGSVHSEHDTLSHIRHTVIATRPFISAVNVSQGLYFMFGTGFEFTDNTKPLPLISIAVLIAVVIIAILLVPIFGGKGAAAGSILGWIVMIILIYYFSQRRFPITYDWQSVNCFFVFSSLFVLLGYWTHNLPVFPRIVHI